MKSLKLSAVIDKNTLASDRAWLIALKVHVIDPDTGVEVDQLRVVRNDEKVTIKGEEYEPVPFGIETTNSAGELPSVTVNLQDQTQTIQALMQEHRGGVGFVVEMIIVHGNSTNVIDEEELHEFFTVISASASDYVVTWQLGAENPLNMQFPERKQQKDRCAWKYKGDGCFYSGPLPTCSRTYAGPDGCQAHDNVENYGGFPGIVVRG